MLTAFPLTLVQFPSSSLFPKHAPFLPGVCYSIRVKCFVWDLEYK